MDTNYRDIINTLNQDKIKERIENLEKENKLLKENLYLFMSHIAEDINLVGNSGAPILKSQGLQKVITDFRDLLMSEEEKKKQKL